ncbi:hypothetical protein [Colwellia echini]|uniref:PilZ domain-containing protein n=1 Tax=Colwellia echini TaxID=1982103 RepID=A0ABY3MT57_9GAMM|nr:hypothetical protein [Colwellia echini]TYK64360.1 hypothetical protein CWS31_015965 [Colwellia echini]
MQFSSEELDFFSNIFTETSAEGQLKDDQADDSGKQPRITRQKLRVETNVPPYLRQVLVESKLTLLAEISHYQLWFPVALSFTGKGDFLPKLGTPEIIDVQGIERSWRVDTPKDVALIDVFSEQKIEVLSLSATGLTLSMPSFKGNALDLLQSTFEMSLAGDTPLKLELDLVRHENNVVAAKFKDIQQGRESLRKFLFNSHKLKYANLYQDVIL